VSRCGARLAKTGSSRSFKLPDQNDPRLHLIVRVNGANENKSIDCQASIYVGDTLQRDTHGISRLFEKLNKVQ
jgi:hypothetical protein